MLVTILYLAPAEKRAIPPLSIAYLLLCVLWALPLAITSKHILLL
jgi:hypothetical protein